jgi:hypothetical protein
MRWARYAARMGELKMLTQIYKKSQGKIPLGRSGARLQDNIKMGLKYGLALSESGYRPLSGCCRHRNSGFHVREEIYCRAELLLARLGLFHGVRTVNITNKIQESVYF